jgi:hypothetical protein
MLAPPFDKLLMMQEQIVRPFTTIFPAEFHSTRKFLRRSLSIAPHPGSALHLPTPQVKMRLM